MLRKTSDPKTRVDLNQIEEKEIHFCWKGHIPKAEQLWQNFQMGTF